MVVRISNWRQHAKPKAEWIVTLDLDFSDITAFPPEEYAGIVVLRVRSQSKPHVMSIFRSLLPLLDTEPLNGYLWIVEENRVRVWHRW